MIAWSRYAAKAIVAFAVPAAVVTANLATEWVGITDDGVVDVNEGYAYALAVTTAVGVFFKKNAQKPQ